MSKGGGGSTRTITSTTGATPFAQPFLKFGVEEAKRLYEEARKAALDTVEEIKKASDEIFKNSEVLIELTRQSASDLESTKQETIARAETLSESARAASSSRTAGGSVGGGCGVGIKSEQFLISVNKNSV